MFKIDDFQCVFAPVCYYLLSAELCLSFLLQVCVMGMNRYWECCSGSLFLVTLRMPFCSVSVAVCFLVQGVGFVTLTSICCV